jgi:hypothetical protein
MNNKPKKYLVIKDYKSPYPEPILFHKGEAVEVGKEFTDDPDWENWVWCEGEKTKGWVPKQFLEINEGSGVFNRDYNALELSVSVGEELLVSEVINGFGMAVKADKQKGWVPIKNLELVEE